MTAGPGPLGQPHRTLSEPTTCKPLDYRRQLDHAINGISPHIPVQAGRGRRRAARPGQD